MEVGEIAVNTADKKIYMRDDSGGAGSIVEVGAGSSLSLPITGGTLSGDLSVSSTADGGPNINLVSNDPGDVADFGTEGAIVFKAENDASQSVEYANIKLLTDDVSDTTEDGRIRFNVAKAGTITDVFDITSTKIQIRQSLPLSWQNAGGSGINTHLEVATPASSRTITLPDATGTVITTGNLSGITSTGTLTGLTVNGNATITKSSGDTKLFIEADSDNDTEGDNAFLIYKLDGGTETSAVWTGNLDGSNDNSLNLSNAGQFCKGIRFATSATNGGWESATERMRIDKEGDITFYGANSNTVFDRSADSFTSLKVDNITLDGSQLDFSSGGTIDTGANLLIDVGAPGSSGNQIEFGLGGSNKGHIDLTGENFTIKSLIQDKDIIFKGDDGGSEITALTLDMSDAGKAIFGNAISIPSSDFANDGFRVTLDGADLTGNQTITLPDATGTVVLGHSTFPTGTTTVGLPTPGAINLANPPENNNHVFHPFLHNDLGHFVERGGSYAWGGLSSTPSADATKTIFNASGDFCTILDNTISGSTYTLTLTNLPKGLTYTSNIGIVFCHDNFSPGSMVIETSTNNGSSWTTRLTDSSSKAVYTTTFSTSGTATNAIRFTLSASPASNQVRIQSIAAYNYQSAGMENYFLPLDGGTVYGNTTFTDNSKLILGTDGDLQIYHNGANSYIDEGSGTGALIFKSNTYSFRNAADSEQLASFGENGAVNLYHDDTLRWFTKDTGTRVMGTSASHAKLLTYGNTSSPTVFKVTVGATNQYHPYNGDGSNSKYFIDGEIGAAIELHGADATTSNSEYIYRFDQSDSSNSNHPIAFYLDAAKNTQYTTGVTTNGTAGQAGAYVQIAVTRNTPKVLYYQCSNHAYMGNYLTVVTAGIGAVVDDTSPQLGGDLDGNTYDIQLDNNNKYQWGQAAAATYIQGNSSSSFPYTDSTIKFFLKSGSNQSTGTMYLESTGIMMPTNMDIRFEGSASDAYETILTVENPTASDKTITLPNATGTVLTTGNSGTPTTITSVPAGLNVLVDDSGTMKKITPANLGVGSGGGGGGIASVSADTNPSLGGNLDANGKNIDLNGGVLKDTDDSNLKVEATLTIDPLGSGSTNAAVFSDNSATFFRDVIISGSSDDLIFDKGTYTTTLTTTNPASQNQTITFPDASGTVALTSQLGGGGGSGVSQEEAIAFAIALG